MKKELIKVTLMDVVCRMTIAEGSTCSCRVFYFMNSNLVYMGDDLEHSRPNTPVQMTE